MPSSLVQRDLLVVVLKRCRQAVLSTAADPLFLKGSHTGFIQPMQGHGWQCNHANAFMPWVSSAGPASTKLQPNLFLVCLFPADIQTSMAQVYQVPHEVG